MKRLRIAKMTTNATLTLRVRDQLAVQKPLHAAKIATKLCCNSSKSNDAWRHNAPLMLYQRKYGRLEKIE